MKFKRNTRYFMQGLIVSALLAATAVPAMLQWDTPVYASAAAPAGSVQQMAEKLAGGMNRREKSIAVEYKGNTDNLDQKVAAAIKQAMAADPYVHYIIEGYRYSYRKTSRSADIAVQMQYRETLEQSAYVEAGVKEILNGMLKPGMSAHDTVKAVHDWVVLNVEYDTGMKKFTAYEALHDGTAVCQGYALLTYKLLKEAGIYNKIVEGKAQAPGQKAALHAWNLVYLNGNWYHLDATWNDPVPDRPGVVGYAYYMRTDRQMRSDHSWSDTYPAAGVSYEDTLRAVEAKGGGGESVSLLREALGYGD